MNLFSIATVGLLLLGNPGGQNTQSGPRAPAPETKPPLPQETVVRVPPRINPKTCAFPAYPESCRRKKEEGTVLLEVEVKADGKISSLRVAKSSEIPALDETAKAAVEKWVFYPGTVNGIPKADRIRLPFQFRLDPPKPAKN